ncbi:MAG: YfhO family protein, partial [Nitrospinae bacterium]|nr:YfhO family protein [Nitrospinota bacterium]
HFLYEYLPFFNKLRYPVKFIFMAVMILSIVAGLGDDYFKKELVGNKPEAKKWARLTLSLGFFCMFVFGMFNLFNEPLVAYFKSIGWDHPNYNETESNLFNIKRFLAFSSLFCLGLFLYSRQKFKHSYIQTALIALFISDLFFAHFMFYQKENYIEIQKVGKTTKFMQSDPEQFRFYVTLKTRKAVPSNIKDWEGIDMRKEKLLLDLIGNRSLYNIDGIGVTEQFRWKKILSLVKSAPPTDSLMLLNLMNVKYVVSIPPIDSPDFKLVHSVYPRVEDPEKNKEMERIVGIKIYENKNMLPRAFLVPNCKLVKNEGEYKRFFQDRLLKPKSLVLLEKQPEGFDCEKKINPDFKNQGSVKTNSYKSNTVDLEVNSPDRQFLFMSDSFYPGWKVFVDGNEKEILRANYLFRAVVIGPGEHQVRFEYDPLSFKLGLTITVITFLFCGIYLFQGRNRRKTQEISS